MIDDSDGVHDEVVLVACMSAQARSCSKGPGACNPSCYLTLGKRCACSYDAVSTRRWKLSPSLTAVICACFRGHIEDNRAFVDNSSSSSSRSAMDKHRRRARRDRRAGRAAKPLVVMEEGVAVGAESLRVVDLGFAPPPPELGDLV